MIRLALIFLALLSGCASVEPSGTPRKEHVIAATDDNRLIRFNAGRPGRILSQAALSGLQPGETLLGIDYRVARGVLYGLGSSGVVYMLNVQSGRATAAGAPAAVKLEGQQFGFDFNPTVDRIRVISDAGQSLRLHPDTGALVQADGRLAYATTDPNAGRGPRVAAAGYTYNKTNDKITTNFVIDSALGTLVTMGTREGRTPAVSPNTGQLFTVGALGTGAVERASFDISDLDNSAFAALGSNFYSVNLETGTATYIGRLPGPVRGIAIEP